MKPVGKPDAGNPHVRFDERGGETDQQNGTAPFLDSTGSLVKLLCCVRQTTDFVARWVYMAHTKMLTDIIEVRPLGEHRLFLRFDDGTSRQVDLAPLLRFDGVFAPL